MTTPAGDPARDVTAELDRLWELAADATPGPWRASGSTVWRPTGDGTPTDFSGVALAYTRYRSEIDPPIVEPDAAYIAAANPDIILRLVAMARETEQLRFALETLAEPLRQKLEKLGGAGSLDAAWQAAEAALPEGGKTTLMVSTLPVAFGGQVKAEAYAHPANRNYERMAAGSGPTPAAALLALAAALRERTP